MKIYIFDELIIINNEERKHRFNYRSKYPSASSEMLSRLGPLRCELILIQRNPEKEQINEMYYAVLINNWLRCGSV